MNKAAKMKPIDILIAEDNPTDVMLAREVILHAEAPNTLHVVDDGVEVMEFLRREGRHGGAPRPDLVLLDLDMPRKNGQEALVEIKADKSLRAIPVVILTGSKTFADVANAFRQDADSYIMKPLDFDAFAEVLEKIQSFWLPAATPPRA